MTGSASVTLGAERVLPLIRAELALAEQQCGLVLLTENELVTIEELITSALDEITQMQEDLDALDSENSHAWSEIDRLTEGAYFA